VIRANAPISSAPDRVRRDGLPLRSARRRLSRSRIPVGRGRRTPGWSAGRVHPAARTVRRATHRLPSPSGSVDPPRRHPDPAPRSLSPSTRKVVPRACTVVSAACTVISATCTVISATCTVISTSMHGHLYKPARSSLRHARSSVRHARSSLQPVNSAPHRDDLASRTAPACRAGPTPADVRSFPRVGASYRPPRPGGRNPTCADALCNHFAFGDDLVSRGVEAGETVRP
jgi:hypothetical protein